MPTTTVTSELYHEVRGAGPSVLFISGASGDAGHFSRAAERLADEFATVCFDRRGCSRSAALAEGEAMSISAQADDAAALLEELGLAPTTIFGTSGGGNIALELVARHPNGVRGAVVHEPALISVLPDTDDEGFARLELAKRRPREAMERFVREHTSDATFESLDPDHRERVLGNGVNFFSREIEAFRSYLPDVERVRASGVPIRVLAGDETDSGSRQASAWLAERLGVSVGLASGHHAPYLQDPERFVEDVRPILRELSS